MLMTNVKANAINLRERIYVSVMGEEPAGSAIRIQEAQAGIFFLFLSYFLFSKFHCP